MPLPLILGAGAAIAGVIGVGNAIHGAAELADANDTMKSAKERHERNLSMFENVNRTTCEKMDTLGTLELEILKDFESFSDTIEKLQNRPQFQEYRKDGIVLPKYDKEKLKEVSVGAGVLLGGLGGAALGTAGGYAAAGATYSAVWALGMASTGTPLALLHGAAAANGILAALGGGALAAGGGGIALGTTILGAATLGVGILVGGVVFNLVGSGLSSKADEAWNQMREAEKKIDKICSHLRKLQRAAVNYRTSLETVRKKYTETFGYISYVVNTMHKTDWNFFSEQEKLATENTVLLVGLLYKMCQVKLVIQAKSENEINSVNQADIDKAIQDSKDVLNKIA